MKLGQNILTAFTGGRLTLMPKECQLCVAQCGYLGCVVGGCFVKVDQAKVAAVANYKLPTTKKEV